MLNVGGDEFFIDLLFYHLKLRSYVVIELKGGKFKPEHLGQLGFYLTAVDTQVKRSDDGPTIGLLLCKGKNKVVADTHCAITPNRLVLPSINWSNPCPPNCRPACQVSSRSSGN